MNDSYLSHSGIKGMKWGVRRYQNEDGSLTEAGKSRYFGNKRYNKFLTKLPTHNADRRISRDMRRGVKNAVVDTVRTVFIWLYFLILPPVEGTEEHFYFVQLIGFIFMVFGTLVYNEIITIPFWNLDYYTRDNIAKREKDEKDEKEKGGEPNEKDKLYLSGAKDSTGNENPPQNDE